MRVVAGLYSTVKPTHRQTPSLNTNTASMEAAAAERARKAKEKEDRKTKEREAEEERRKQRQVAAANKSRPTANKQRKPFNFEQEKPAILTSIANASQCTNNLINALKLVNREKESIQDNPRVQETLTAAKAARKQVVRYIQLVENEELIGTLIDTNERIIAALDMYDTLLKTADEDSDETPPASAVESTEAGPNWARSSSASISGQLERLQEKQRVAVERAKARANAHPDLQDLNFDEGSRLPPPIKPSAPGSTNHRNNDHGSLSDFSDYESSSDEAPRASTSTGRPSTSSKFDYKNKGNIYDDYESGDNTQNLLDDEDPFADPFADQNSDVGTPGIPEKGQPKWTVTA